MADVIQYDVVANLVAKGSFAAMRKIAGVMKPVFNNIGAIGQKVSSLGSAIKGTTASTASGWAKTATSVAALGSAAGMGAVVKHGLGFNKLLEDSTLEIATMYNLFDFASNAAEVVNGEISQWKYNLQASKAVFQEIYDISADMPGSFQDISEMYRSAASGLSTQTQDLSKHVDFLEKAALLGGLTGGDYQVLGAQTGRILAGSAGAEMNVWKVLQGPILEAGKRMDIFSKKMKANTDELTQSFNKLGGDDRLRLMMEAMAELGPEVADAWAKSMDGVIGTTKSVLDDLAGRATKPLYDTIRRGLTTVLGGDDVDRLKDFADQIGVKLAFAGAWMFTQARKAVVFIRDNWEKIMTVAKKAATVIAGAIKGAFAYGATRLAVGTGLQVAGGAARGVGGAVSFAKSLGPFFSKHARSNYEGIIKGMKGTKKETRMMPKRDAKSGRFLKGEKEPVTRLVAGGPWQKFIGTFRTFLSLGVAAIPVFAAVVILLGGVLTLVGGLAAYIISNWKDISGAIVKGLKDGSVTLKPLLIAAYQFWGRLKLVGLMLLGSGNHASQFNVVLAFLTDVFILGSKAVSFFLRGMAFFVGIWYTAKLAVYGFMHVFMGYLELLYRLGAIDLGTIGNARNNFKKFGEGLDETAATGAKMLATANKIDEFKLSESELANIDKEAEKMAKSLQEMLEGGGDMEDPKTPGAKVHIENNYQNIDLRDEDPDRMMSMLINPLARLADRRVESRALPVGGV